ncbi:MAG: chromosome partitioning protein ParB [endosymbiont of Galathealinum brachiosum]|uniref:Probable chromosome-partitioning protein ParB n=1 Tax=endosymbiont of Galathealinum brachiosum TaxID=2200906 RepID=A0A370DCT8_9GAMM|nr:MAG: chromosome partitioning protein ParB [endosymbiont of Galathealinum brachiosum]
MVKKKRGLGRGLNALLGSAAEVKELTDPKPAPTAPVEAPVETTDNGLRHIAVELIQRGTYQPRVHFEPEALQELADSIKTQGVIQPIVVRPVSAGKFEIIAGERRWRACQLAGLHEVPAVVKELNDQSAAAISLIENIQRENLNPLEESRALQRLIDEFDMTHQQVSEVVSRSRASVTNLLRLKDLNEDVKLLVDERKIDMGHARALLALTGAEQSLLANKASAQGWSVRETEKQVKRQLNPAPKVTESSASIDPDIKRLQEQVSERLGAPVNVQHKSNGKGKLVINYSSLDELDGILAKIQ